MSVVNGEFKGRTETQIQNITDNLSRLEQKVGFLETKIENLDNKFEAKFEEMLSGISDLTTELKVQRERSKWVTRLSNLAFGLGGALAGSGVTALLTKLK